MLKITIEGTFTKITVDVNESDLDPTDIAKSLIPLLKTVISRDFPDPDDGTGG